MWRDDLAQIVALVSQVESGNVVIEADDYRLDDVDSELSKISDRISYFQVNVLATDSSSSAPTNLLEIRLSKDECYVEAVNPSPEIRGVISDIQSFAAKHQQLPKWIPKRALPDASTTVECITGVIALTVLGFIVSFIIIGISLGIIGGLVHSKETASKDEYYLILSSIACGLSLLASIYLVMRSSTLLITGTRAEAPTWWQEYRSHTMIGVATSTVFFLLGLLVGGS